MDDKKIHEDLADSQIVKYMKGLIRNSEAKIAVNSIGIDKKNVYSL